MKTPRVPHVVLRRAWVMQASWHPTRMQGLGMLYALLPVLRKSSDVHAACQRYAGYFNMNLWMMPVVVGAIARLENEDRGSDAVRLRDLLAPPLSGVGDAFVWMALRPTCLGAILVTMLAHVPWLGLGLVLAAHGVLLVRQVRIGFEHGWESGADLPGVLGSVQPPRSWTRGLRGTGMLLAGGLLAWSLGDSWRLGPSVALVVGLTLALGYYAGKRQHTVEIAFVVLVVLASVARRVHFSNPVGLP